MTAPRWMDRNNDWDGGIAHRHLPLAEATELLKERQAARKNARPLQSPTGLHTAVVDCGAKSRRGAPEKETPWTP